MSALKRGRGDGEGAEELVSYVNFLKEERGTGRNRQPRIQFLKWGQGGGVGKLTRPFMKGTSLPKGKKRNI